MCKRCLRSYMPDRGTFVADNGAYMLNFAGCAKCMHMELDAVLRRKPVATKSEPETDAPIHGAQSDSIDGADDPDDPNEADDSDEEGAETFEHVCRNCKHIVATHIHRFEETAAYQESSMECGLCGFGQSTASIMPYDRRLAARYNEIVRES
ncbi:uncharacterized protein BJ171DRAFT_519758 [Polychytrium aggregatum]|uniref:uncharacterized protein n=1 Tax=Polychytrium aggregatum TaxID=110093 RepID=UPI0022FE52CF|nr:uncharacterized protein BJ171DRAFT_519758 [Polychytrium aggregatum]KAI9197502.1 hypothetical protein BJ171DRAFT_519758 [Polychytrium aggregatum]